MVRMIKSSPVSQFWNLLLGCALGRFDLFISGIINAKTYTSHIEIRDCGLFSGLGL